VTVQQPAPLVATMSGRSGSAPGIEQAVKSTRSYVMQGQGTAGAGAATRRRRASRASRTPGAARTAGPLYSVRSTREALMTEAGAAGTAGAAGATGAAADWQRQRETPDAASAAPRSSSPRGDARAAGSAALNVSATCKRDVALNVVNHLLELSQGWKGSDAAGSGGTEHSACAAFLTAETPRALARTLLADCSEKDAGATMHAAAEYAAAKGDDSVAARLRHAAQSSDVNELSWRMLEQDVGVDAGAHDALVRYARDILTTSALPHELRQYFTGRPAESARDTYALLDHISREAPWPEHLYEERPTHADVLRALALAADSILVEDADPRVRALPGNAVLCTRLASVYAMAGPSGDGIAAASTAVMPSKYAEARARRVRDCMRVLTGALDRFGKGIARALASDATAAPGSIAVTDDADVRSVLTSPEYATVKQVWRRALSRLIGTLCVEPGEEEPVYVAAIANVEQMPMDPYARDLLSSVREEDVERYAAAESAMRSFSGDARACMLRLAAALDMRVNPAVYSRVEMKSSLVEARECVQAMRASGDSALAKQILDSALLGSVSKGSDPIADVRALSSAYGKIWF